MIDTLPPDTTIDSGPPAETTSTDASFTFSGAGASGFQCSLDAIPFEACGSPRAYTGLALGAHNFQVRALDAAGNIDPTRGPLVDRRVQRRGASRPGHGVLASVLTFSLPGRR